mmetsp:Transcript_23875/g.42587  ORF Transcript_23875/g.42587 Transcript_23875/m.42587 type:complete len:220 (-) Transcript_23875:287-946(-)
MAVMDPPVKAKVKFSTTLKNTVLFLEFQQSPDKEETAEQSAIRLFDFFEKVRVAKEEALASSAANNIISRAATEQNAESTTSTVPAQENCNAISPTDLTAPVSSQPTIVHLNPSSPALSEEQKKLLEISSPPWTQLMFYSTYDAEKAKEKANRALKNDAKVASKAAAASGEFSSMTEEENNKKRGREDGEQGEKKTEDHRGEGEQKEGDTMKRQAVEEN